ncbi:hypothetical protein M0R04_07335 [Candidatus Dojkabacteria bacterium]|nr:hypothetical protein [Candidatus Dojkabacteria bacterium]
MISLRWTLRNESSKGVGTHGYDFTKDNDYKYQLSSWFPPKSWRDYTTWYAEEHPHAVRVFVNKELVYHWEKGWLVDINTFIPPIL